MAKTNTKPKRKPVWQLSRRGVYGTIALVLAACAWTFFLGVLVGRGTAPVHFDMEKLGQDLQALREQVQQHQAQQLQTYSEAVESKSDLDFYEDLKASGENLSIDPNLTRSPPQPTAVAAPSAPTDTSETKELGGIPVKRRMAGLQPKKPSVTGNPNPALNASAAGSGTAPAGAFTLQVASLRDSKVADEMVARLRREGYQVTRSGVSIPGKGRWYRVQVGRFRDRQAAAATIDALESKGLKPILVSR